MVTTLAVPRAVRAVAREGLELHAAGFGGRGLTKGAIVRARRLARGLPITTETARMMRGWFRRHVYDARPGWRARKTPGWVAWQLWGGTAAWRWVERKLVLSGLAPGSRALAPSCARIP